MERAVFATLLWRGITKAGPSPRSAMKQQEMGSLFYGAMQNRENHLQNP